MWIHQHHEWPHFTWDIEKLAVQVAAVRHQQGRLLGKMEGLGFTLQREAHLNMLTDDVVKSSAIEGEHLNPQEVRSSIARRLGLDVAGLIPASRHVEGIVEMMLDATQHFDQPLTKERLCNWHAALFPTGRSGLHRITVGAWRPVEAGPMRVISGAAGRETVHFEAPAADRLETEMTAFLTWFENERTLDPVLKTGIAHFWFVTIHPFEDGNGRIARAIADLALARADRMAERFYSLSSQIEQERKAYYQHLEIQQRASLDITYWLEWFITCFARALATAENTLTTVQRKARLWKTCHHQGINERQRLILTRMLEDNFSGYMNTAKYAKIAHCSNDTALRDIQDLKSKGLFTQNPGGGRSTSYRLTDEIG